MNTSRLSALSTSIILILSCGYQSVVDAQEKPTQKDEQEIETLVITSNPMNRSILESATPVSIIGGEDLKARVAPTLGETLKNVPGVNSTYFGPVSSSPIIRGLDGPRIKILQNGLDVSDASRIGPDHIVSTEAANATQIEVLRGPATLLYGSGAIGGVVNVVDNRLPTQDRESVEGEFSYMHDSVSSEDTINLALDGGNDGLVWHLDGFDRKTEDYKIPGAADIDGEGHRGTLENSFIDAQGFSVGGGWISDNQNIAFSYGNLKSDYGIPGHSHEDEHADEDHGDEAHEEEPSLFGRLNQDRYQALFDWTGLEGWISEVRFRNAYTDYTHSEIENGEIGTTFANKTLESRLWAKHKAVDGWEGVLGVNYVASDFSALGEEAFTPASKTKTYAVYLLEEKKIDDFLWQFGGRVERVNVAPDTEFYADDALASAIQEETFTAASVSAGFVYTLTPESTLAFNLAHSSRAPTAAEMFSNGLHIATSTYELGSAFYLQEDQGSITIAPALAATDKEVSNNIDFTYHILTENVEASFSLFFNRIGNYIYQQNSGVFYDSTSETLQTEAGQDLLPIFVFRQQDADIYGFEAEVDYHFNDTLRLKTFADSTHAQLRDDQYVPRIPPLRVGAELHWEDADWHAEIGTTYYAKQSNIAEYETPTESYTLLSAALNYYMTIDNSDLTFYIKGNNLTNTDARVHSSFIKDYAPLPGRSIVVGTRVNF